MNFKLITAVIAILWVGMLLAIDFGAVAKFATPSLTKPVAFDVGRVVFGAFNKVQIVMLFILVFSALMATIAPIDRALIAAVAAIFLLQLLWLFPILSHQVAVILQGRAISRGYEHHLYGVFEIAKILSLFILGIRLLRTA